MGGFGRSTSAGNVKDVWILRSDVEVLESNKDRHVDESDVLVDRSTCITKTGSVENVDKADIGSKAVTSVLGIVSGWKSQSSPPEGINHQIMISRITISIIFNDVLLISENKYGRRGG
jgi:hypothetical protein